MANRLKALRKELRLTQAEIASILGVGEAKISKLENSVGPNGQPLNEHYIDLMIKKFPDLKAWMFFHDPNEIKAEILSEDELMFLRDYIKLSDIHRNKIHGAIDVYLQEQESKGD